MVGSCQCHVLQCFNMFFVSTLFHSPAVKFSFTHLNWKKYIMLQDNEKTFKAVLVVAIHVVAVVAV